MITKKIMSITIIIAMAAMFFSSSAFVNPLLAKTVVINDASKDKAKDSNKADPTTSNLVSDSIFSKAKDSNKADPTTSTSNSAERNFKEFQKCLSDTESTKGFATNREIKDCYNPLYRPLLSSTTNTNTVKPIDFSSPIDFSKENSNDQ
jgi:hypothetical protein